MQYGGNVQAFGNKGQAIIVLVYACSCLWISMNAFESTCSVDVHESACNVHGCMCTRECAWTCIRVYINLLHVYLCHLMCACVRKCNMHEFGHMFSWMHVERCGHSCRHGMCMESCSMHMLARIAIHAALHFRPIHSLWDKDEEAWAMMSLLMPRHIWLCMSVFVGTCICI